MQKLIRECLKQETLFTDGDAFNGVFYKENVEINHNAFEIGNLMDCWVYLMRCGKVDLELVTQWLVF